MKHEQHNYEHRTARGETNAGRQLFFLKASTELDGCSTVSDHFRGRITFCFQLSVQDSTCKLRGPKGTTGHMRLEQLINIHRSLTMQEP